VPGAVTRYYQGAEAQTFAALHNLGYTVYRNELVIKV
jgi:hypothetical protein